MRRMHMLYRKLENPQEKLMKESINELVSQYESGKLTRRGLLGAVAFLTAPNHLQAQTSLFRARSLNHVNIRVEDLSRSEAFYTGD